MRLIDADALLQTLSDLCSSDNNTKVRRIVDMVLHDIMTQIINDEPTVDTQTEWIKCSDILPPVHQDVLVFYPPWGDDAIQVAHLLYDGSLWDVCGEFNFGLYAVTHWMPLPEPPEVTP